MESVGKFYEALSRDEAMRSRLSALDGKYQGAQPEAATIAAEIVAFAKAEGFAFTVDDLSAYAETEGKELSDEQLEGIVGGLYDRNTCVCMVGGGGKDPETGHTCACVLGGGGRQDNKGYQLVCIGAGVVDRY